MRSEVIACNISCAEHNVSLLVQTHVLAWQPYVDTAPVLNRLEGTQLFSPAA